MEMIGDALARERRPTSGVIAGLVVKRLLLFISSLSIVIARRDCAGWLICLPIRTFPAQAGNHWRRRQIPDPIDKFETSPGS